MIEGVEISFERWSYGDELRTRAVQSRAIELQMSIAKLQTKATKAQSEGKDVGSRDASAMLKVFEELAEIENAKRTQFAKVVISLPQEMFIKGAPSVDDMDFTDETTYENLRADAVPEVERLIQMAQQGKLEAGK